jgi:hypothetical protein
MERKVGFLRQVLDKKTRGGKPYVCFLLEEEGQQTWINLFDVAYMAGRVGEESDFDIHEWRGERLAVWVEPSEDERYLCCERVEPVQEDPTPFQTAKAGVERGASGVTEGIADDLGGAGSHLSGAQMAEVDRVVLRGMERAGLRSWLSAEALMGQVKNRAGFAPNAADILQSTRRLWKQLKKQGAARTIEHNMGRYRLIKRGGR